MISISSMEIVYISAKNVAFVQNMRLKYLTASAAMEELCAD